MDGFYNRLLRIDLYEQTWSGEDISDQVLRRYLGGKGLVAHLLLEDAPAGGGPLAAESPLVVVTGPATASRLAPANRYALFARSPLLGSSASPTPVGMLPPRSAQLVMTPLSSREQLTIPSTWRSAIRTSPFAMLHPLGAWISTRPRRRLRQRLVCGGRRQSLSEAL
jgi:hypothetical protein